MELNPEIDVPIDPDGLDVCWLEQPDLMLEYGEALADANKERDDAKLGMEKAQEKWKEKKASTALDMKRNPEDYDLPKTSDPTIDEAVASDEGVVEKRDAYFEAVKTFNEKKSEADRLYRRVVALENRKAALEGLIYLFAKQYFAAPSIDRYLKKEAEGRIHAKIEMTRKAAREKIKARRTK